MFTSDSFFGRKFKQLDFNYFCINKFCFWETRIHQIIVESQCVINIWELTSENFIEQKQCYNKKKSYTHIFININNLIAL